jgi:Flp pilus assembly pilin Flp
VRVLCDESGAGILEYGLILSLVAILAVAALLLLGGDSNLSLRRSANGLGDGGSSVSTP